MAEVDDRLLNDGFEHSDIRKVVNLVSSSWNVADLSRFMYGSRMINSVNKKEVKVLDIGCSSGRLMQVQQTFARTPATKRIQYIGVDMRESSLKKVRNFADENLSKEARKRVFTESLNITEQSDCKKLIKKYGKFDVVVLFEVFEHLPIGEHEKTLRYMSKLLDDNGIMILSTPVHFVEEQMYWPDDHEKEFMYEELKELLEKYFVIVHSCGNHIDANKLKRKLKEEQNVYELYKALLDKSKNGVWLNEIFGAKYEECCKGHMFTCKKRGEK